MSNQPEVEVPETIIECSKCGDSIAVTGLTVTLPFVCMSCEKKQEEFQQETEQAEDPVHTPLTEGVTVNGGVKFAYSGTLYVPAPGEAERLAIEEKERKMTILHDAVRKTAIEAAAEQKRKDSLRVRMRPLDFLRLKAR